MPRTRPLPPDAGGLPVGSVAALAAGSPLLGGDALAGRARRRRGRRSDRSPPAGAAAGQLRQDDRREREGQQDDEDGLAGRPVGAGGSGRVMASRPWSRTTGVVRAIGRGKRRRAVVADRPGRSGGLEGGARRVVGGQAQPALLLGRRAGPAVRPRRSDARARRSCSATRRRRRRGRGRCGSPGVRVTEPAGTAVGRLRTCGSSAVIASRIAGTGSTRPGGASARRTGESPRERKNPGDDLFSRKAALSVSSALESLTSVFGMGTGVASPLESPGSFASGSFRQRLDARSR